MRAAFRILALSNSSGGWEVKSDMINSELEVVQSFSSDQRPFFYFSIDLVVESRL